MYFLFQYFSFVGTSSYSIAYLLLRQRAAPGHNENIHIGVLHLPEKHGGADIACAMAYIGRKLCIEVQNTSTLAAGTAEGG